MRSRPFTGPLGFLTGLRVNWGKASKLRSHILGAAAPGGPAPPSQPLLVPGFAGLGTEVLTEICDLRSLSARETSS